MQPAPSEKGCRRRWRDFGLDRGRLGDFPWEAPVAHQDLPSAGFRYFTLPVGWVPNSGAWHLRAGRGTVTPFGVSPVRNPRHSDSFESAWPPWGGPNRSVVVALVTRLVGGGRQARPEAAAAPAVSPAPEGAVRCSLIVRSRDLTTSRGSGADTSASTVAARVLEST